MWCAEKKKKKTEFPAIIFANPSTPARNIGKLRSSAEAAQQQVSHLELLALQPMHHLNLIILVYLAKNFLANALVPFGVLKRQRTPNQSLIPNNMMVSSSTSANNSNDHIVHRYESPFFPSKIANRQSTSAALIILNTPIHTIDKEENCELPAVLKVLWESSTYRICADGGANRLYEATVANWSISTREKTRFLPDLITGDLDSLLPHVREFYEGRGVPVVQIIDQDYHDLDVSIQSAVFVVLLRYHSFVLVCARNR